MKNCQKNVNHCNMVDAKLVEGLQNSGTANGSRQYPRTNQPINQKRPSGQRAAIVLLAGEHIAKKSRKSNHIIQPVSTRADVFAFCLSTPKTPPCACIRAFRRRTFSGSGMFRILSITRQSRTACASGAVLKKQTNSCKQLCPPNSTGESLLYYICL